ncbi:hypothetical protein AB0B51_35430, partial [Streptomyces griseus]
MTLSRRVAALFTSSLVLLGLLFTSSGSAQADEPLAIVCTTSATQNYDPGLTLVSRPTRITTSATYTCTGGGS